MRGGDTAGRRASGTCPSSGPGAPVPPPPTSPAPGRRRHRDPRTPSTGADRDRGRRRQAAGGSGAARPGRRSTGRADRDGSALGVDRPGAPRRDVAARGTTTLGRWCCRREDRSGVRTAVRTVVSRGRGPAARRRPTHVKRLRPTRSPRPPEQVDGDQVAAGRHHGRDRGAVEPPSSAGTSPPWTFRWWLPWRDRSTASPAPTAMPTAPTRRARRRADRLPVSRMRGLQPVTDRVSRRSARPAGRVVPLIRHLPGAVCSPSAVGGMRCVTRRPAEARPVPGAATPRTPARPAR